MRPYPLTPQVMNGTGALRQFVPRVARRSFPGDLWLFARHQSLNDAAMGGDAGGHHPDFVVEEGDWVRDWDPRRSGQVGL